MATGWTSSANQPTKLDQSKESLSLSSILQALDDPVTEEEAWAILYQSAKTGLQCFNSANPRVMRCVVVNLPSQLWIHRDGHVLPHSFQAAADSIEAERRTVAECQSQLVKGLGLTIYGALVYGFAEGKLPNLSDDLEQMTEFLILADSGEAEDSAAAAAAASVFSTSTTSSSSASPAAAAAAYAMKTLSQVMDRCRMHFISKASSDQADALSKIICCKLVADTLRLPVKFSSAAPPEAHPPPRPTPPAPPEAPTAAWVENMMQVIPQLRNGVKSKSASGGESARKPNEYEVTLLDDILSRRCKLHQVMVDGTPPRVKKDARTVALEHIRSRPPLRKASERVLAPRPLDPHVPCLYELLMDSIRQHDSKELKRTGHLLLDNRTDGQQYIHMQELLAVREERLKARERQIADIQKEELERLREEFRVQKELNKQQQKASSKACEACDVMAKELQCLFCSELMVFATSLNCMHTFCQHCIGEWKKQKCHGGSGNSFKRIRLIKRRYY